MTEIKKIKNTRKKNFDHSCDEYYEIELSNGTKLLFTAFELNKALDRSKKWNKIK